jgi:thiamine pyrophosphate-dependent acetolactate synthase large subunit-like protein
LASKKQPVAALPDSTNARVRQWAFARLPTPTENDTLEQVSDLFGAKGLMIRTPDEISSVLQQTFDTPGPVLVGVHVDDSDNLKLFKHVDERSFHQVKCFLDSDYISC